MVYQSEHALHKMGGGGLMLMLIQKDEEYPWSNIYWDNFDWLHLDDEQRIQD